MELPHWAEEQIARLASDFTGQIVIECWQGGVSRVDMTARHLAPKPSEPVRRALS
jgi:hypothetical protein